MIHLYHKCQFLLFVSQLTDCHSSIEAACIEHTEVSGDTQTEIFYILGNLPF